LPKIIQIAQSKQSLKSIAALVEKSPSGSGKESQPADKLLGGRNGQGQGESPTPTSSRETLCGVGHTSDTSAVEFWALFQVVLSPEQEAEGTSCPRFLC
jgi:hypothetical protein